MNLKEILNNKLLDLPKNRKGKWFPEYVREVLNEYMKLTDSIEDYNKEYKLSQQQIQLQIHNTCHAILKSLEAYYNGYPFEAYTFIANLLDNSTSLADNILAKIIKQVSVYDLGNLYRIRNSDSNDSLSRKEMFHVPFNLREKSVKTQRYSIPGFPCLYLSNSIYVAWEELDKPDLNRIHAARIESTENNAFELIDLKHPNELRNKYEKLDEDIELLDYIITWPLVFVCSIRTENKNNSFKSEYIIPQILLQYIRRNNFHRGIKYFSNNIDYSKQNIGSFYNVAIPVFEMKEKGYCRFLKNGFKMTESISLQKVEAALGGQFTFDKSGTNCNLEVKEIEIIKGKPFPYRYSVFHELEKQLTNLEAKKIEF